jgi:hypothetical protein
MVREGYSIAMTESGYPVAISLSSSLTGILVPEIIGVPPNISGSLTTMLCSVVFFVAISVYYTKYFFSLGLCISTDCFEQCIG